MEIGLIGLGNAGKPMAIRLLSTGHRVRVYDLDAGAVAGAVARGAIAAESAEHAVGEITITLLPSSNEVRQALFGTDGAAPAIRAGQTLVDLSGTDPDFAREVAAHVAANRAQFIGGTIHASGAPAISIPNGQFSIVIGGDRGALERVAGVLSHVAQTIICLPEAWMPKAFKIAVILYATTNNIVTAEVCSWLTAQGADPKLFLKLLQTTGSHPTASRLEEFMTRNNTNGGALSNSYKDFRQALATAARLEMPMPLVSMANQIQEMGRANALTRFNSPAAMGKLYELLTGQDLSGVTIERNRRIRDKQEPRIVWLDG